MVELELGLGVLVCQLTEGEFVCVPAMLIDRDEVLWFNEGL
jgi:hypothetical protein